MSSPNIDIVDFDHTLDDWHYGLHIGKTYEQAFRPVNPDSLLGSLSGLRSAIRWSWLQWRRKADFGPISDALRFVTLRSAAALGAKRIPRDSFRGLHDRMLLCCSVLSADFETMSVAAERAIEASTRGEAKA